MGLCDFQQAKTNGETYCRKIDSILMKKTLGIFGAIAISASLITGCGDSTNKSDVSNAMVDSVVLPSYSKLAKASKELNQALQTLAITRLEDNSLPDITLPAHYMHTVGLIQSDRWFRLIHSY